MLLPSHAPDHCFLKKDCKPQTPDQGTPRMKQRRKTLLNCPLFLPLPPSCVTEVSPPVWPFRAPFSSKTPINTLHYPSRSGHPRSPLHQSSRLAPNVDAGHITTSSPPSPHSGRIRPCLRPHMRLGSLHPCCRPHREGAAAQQNSRLSRNSKAQALAGPHACTRHPPPAAAMVATAAAPC